MGRWAEEILFWICSLYFWAGRMCECVRLTGALFKRSLPSLIPSAMPCSLLLRMNLAWIHPTPPSFLCLIHIPIIIYSMIKCYKQSGLWCVDTLQLFYNISIHNTIMKLLKFHCHYWNSNCGAPWVFEFRRTMTQIATFQITWLYWSLLWVMQGRRTFCLGVFLWLCLYTFLTRLAWLVWSVNREWKGFCLAWGE